jgi:opacity protein-like surface antigen
MRTDNEKPATAENKTRHYPYLCSLAIVLLLAGHSSRSEAQNETSLIFEFDLSKIYFEDEVLDGDIAHAGLGIAYAINPEYEIGYSLSNNLFFGASLDRAPDLDTAEDVETEVKLLYLRRYWRTGDKTTVFGQIGYAKTEIRIEYITVCLFFCGNLATFNSRTTYRNRESGYAWGLGIQQRLSHTSHLYLKYIDYSRSDLDFSGFHLGIQQYFGA